MDAETVTELDQRSKDELAPPCDQLKVTPGTRRVTSECADVARWAVRTSCAQCGPRPLKLRCERHAHVLLSGEMTTCQGCLHRGPVHVLSAVRL